ncbi:MAG: nuclear transport factor 2 family protein [Rhizobiaceae bacterium]|nr:nuclear transport factor 2 family protein [Rhizobiaceae bacterium]
MKSDIAAVEAAVWDYLEALHEGDVERLARVFAPASALHASTDGAATAIAIEPWLDRVRNRKSAKDSGFEPQNRIHAIEVVGDMAMAKVSSAFPPKQFTDFLSLVRTKDGWRIAAKTYFAQDL